MKILHKAIALLFLLLVLLTSCNTSTPQPVIRATDVMETSMAIVKTEFVGTLTAAPTSTPTFSLATPSPIPPTPTLVFPVPFDRHDPEAVLRAYFDAWHRNDWLIKDALTYGRPTAPEPVEWLQVLEIKNISSSPTESTYSVWFEIKVKGQGVSMHSGKNLWKYFLIWDPNHDSWYIAGHGGGG
jgi:hypothetical protein